MKKRVIASIALFILCHALVVSAAETKSTKGKSGPKSKGKTATQVKPGTDPATGMEFVLVKGGCFTMGSTVRDDEKPVHEVCVKDFYLGKYEVTQAQWVKIMGSNPSSFKACGPDCPVESVSWNDVQAFIGNLSAKSKKPYRLPTEAEWEYAATNGKRDVWAGTSSESKLGEFGWYAANSGGETTHKVGQKKPNALGLYDMSGNVWEWCQDYYSTTYYGEGVKDDPAGPEKGQDRAVRGGSYENDPSSLRGTNRDNVDGGERDKYRGFRLAFPAQ
jgi:formylglycine-generating enzyme required for sulfatase activity